jgi:hypothetical protein
VYGIILTSTTGSADSNPLCIIIRPTRGRPPSYRLCPKSNKNLPTKIMLEIGLELEMVIEVEFEMGLRVEMAVTFIEASLITFK